MLGPLVAILLMNTPAAPQVVGWDEFVERVEETSPLMAAARSGLERFGHTMNRADWAYFPSFRLESGVAPVPSISGEGFDATVGKAQELGAHLCMPVTEIPGKGRFAGVAGPQGAAIAFWEFAK